ncbi:MAG TPA: hypothetical protein PK794_11045, partial [Armatimonadota bacterium]|nr:hypothetical protein [Armatimonadota bacterium]
IAKVLTTYQPDLKLRIPADAAYAGDNVYNTTGTGQSTAQSCQAGNTVLYLVHLQNDGNQDDRLRVTGTAGGNGWTVQYLDMQTLADLTALVTGAGLTTELLPPGLYRWIGVKITPSSSLAHGAVKDVVLTAVSTTDTAKTDVIKARTTYRAVP